MVMVHWRYEKGPLWESRLWHLGFSRAGVPFKVEYRNFSKEVKLWRWELARLFRPLSPRSCYSQLDSVYAKARNLTRTPYCCLMLHSASTFSISGLQGIDATCSWSSVQASVAWSDTRCSPRAQQRGGTILSRWRIVFRGNWNATNRRQTFFLFFFVQKPPRPSIHFDLLFLILLKTLLWIPQTQSIYMQ